MVTLKKFVEDHGSQRAAAERLGVTLRTISRWLNKANSPSPMAKLVCESHGIKLTNK